MAIAAPTNGRTRRMEFSSALSRWHLPALAAGAALIAAPSAYQTGDDLFRLCTSSKPAEAWQCLGYVEAVSDVLAAGDGVSGWFACIPPQVKSGQMRDIVVIFLRTEPERRNRTATSLMGKALSSTFPCKR